MTGTGNRSSAVVAQRSEPRDSFDYFPTPAWGTRALLMQLDRLGVQSDFSGSTCLEPACGEGHMARPLAEVFGTVDAADVQSLGYGRQADFLWPGVDRQYDWVITNPPFKLASQFCFKAFTVARVGVAMLLRLQFKETPNRCRWFFSGQGFERVALEMTFSERISIVKGRVDPSANRPTAYCWFVWLRHRPIWMAPDRTYGEMIPPCRKALERPGDYLPVADRESA